MTLFDLALLVTIVIGGAYLLPGRRKAGTVRPARAMPGGFTRYAMLCLFMSCCLVWVALTVGGGLS